VTETREDHLTFYRGRRVMITGGLGFIGSNLARELVSLGATVLIVDALHPDYGGNLFNISDVADRVRVNIADVRMQSTIAVLAKGQDVIFNLAGQVSHIDSMRDPYTDLEINCRAQLSILEACRANNPSVRIVYAGTRQVYGRPDYLPVDEKHLVRPADINGVNKAAGEYYHLLYNNVFDVRACSLRLTNVYGPRQLIKHNRQGFIGWFIRLALEDDEIQVFGDGLQMRDFVYVDDAADAFLRAGASNACDGDVFNVGGDEAITHKDLVALLLETAGTGRVRFVEWPPEKKRIDIGSFYTDSTKFQQATGWRPQVPLKEGLRRTILFYREHMHHYVDAPAAAATSTAVQPPGRP
jgi:UDP-glucose 4-epimerase